MRELRFFLGEAWDYLVRGRGTSLASVIALSSVFFLFALVLLITFNVRVLANQFEARKGLTVFFEEGVSEDRARQLGDIFAGFGEVGEVVFVDRERALRELEADLGGFPVGTTLGENPLPHSLVLHLSDESTGRRGVLQDLALEIQSYEDVEEVIFGGKWVETLDRNLRLVRIANVSVGTLASVAVIVVLLTTLRLLFVGRKETLRILKVVGATDQFIRLPFLFLGAMQCSLAAVLALVLILGAQWFLDAILPGMRLLPLGWQVTFLLGAAALGFGASWVAIEPSLRKLEKRREEVLR